MFVSKRLLVLISLLVVVSLAVLPACAGGTPSPEPTKAPATQATKAPAAAEATKPAAAPTKAAAEATKPAAAPAKEAAAGTIKIGAAGPFSGQLSKIGIDALNAVKFAGFVAQRYDRPPARGLLNFLRAF